MRFMNRTVRKNRLAKWVGLPINDAFGENYNTQDLKPEVAFVDIALAA